MENAGRQRAINFHETVHHLEEIFYTLLAWVHVLYLVLFLHAFSVSLLHKMQYIYIRLLLHDSSTNRELLQANN